MRPALMSVDGVVAAEVSFDDERADVRYRPGLVEPDALIEAIVDAGFQASVIDSENMAAAAS